MTDERARIPGRELGRWLLVAAILVLGIALYFYYAPRAEPVVRSVAPGHHAVSLIHLTLPDGSVRELPAGTTGRAVAQAIGPGLARAALAARVNGAVWDLDRPIEQDATVAILTERDPDALEVLRHSRRTSWPPRCASSFPARASGSARRSRTASTTTSRCRARSRPRTSRRSSGRWARWRSGTIRSSARWWIAPRPTAASPTIRSSSSGSASWAPTR